MKPPLLIILFAHLLICTSAFSQSVSRQLFGSGGSNSVPINGTYYVSWSMGEPVVNTLTGGLPLLTQGFQQPENFIPLIVGGLQLTVGSQQSAGRYDAFLQWEDGAEGPFRYQIEWIQRATGWQKLGETVADIFRHYDLPSQGGAIFYRVTALGPDGSIRHSNVVELPLQSPDSPSVFPNPTSGFLYIENIPPNSRLQFYDMTGKVLIDQSSDSQDFQLDLRHLPAAIYLLFITNGENHFSQKIEIIR